jgi:hypothetical protein
MGEIIEPTSTVVAAVGAAAIRFAIMGARERKGLAANHVVGGFHGGLAANLLHRIADARLCHV